MIWEWVLYILLYLITTIVLVTTVSWLIVYISEKVFNIDLAESHFGNFDLFIRVLVAIIIPLIATYFIFSALNYSIPFNLASEEEKLDTEVTELAKEIERINGTLSDIDNLTLGQIRKELSTTLEVFKKLKEKSITQQLTIIRLQKIVVDEKSKAQEAKRYADNISSLSKRQIEDIKALITMDVKEQNERSFWIGALISLPIGLIASFLASFLWNLARRKTGTNKI